MTTNELLTSMRNVLRYDFDAVKASADMTDAEGVAYLNQAQNEIARMLRIYRTGVTVTVPADTRSVLFSSTAFERMPIEIVQVFNGTLEMASAIDFPVTSISTDPTVWWVEGETLRFDGVFDAPTALTMCGYFGEAKMTTAGGSTENTLPDILQPRLAEYAAVIAVRGTATEGSQVNRAMALERGMKSAVRMVKSSIKAHQFSGVPAISQLRYRS